MGFFGFRKRKYWNEVFSDCDFDFARALLIHTFSGGIIPNDLVKLLDLFNNNPCRETAIELIEFDKQEFLKFFADNRTSMEQMMEEKEIEKEQLINQLHKNVAQLHQEPDFQAYCAAFLEDDPTDILREKTADLVEKGYSKEMIYKAFSGYMQE